MNLLLDTHVVLWWLDDNPALSGEARAAIADGKNLVFVSAAVIWEIRIKQALGKLDIPQDFCQVLDSQPFESLSISADHAHAVVHLASHHRDPFDRILVAQAKVEKMTLVTHDERLELYGVPLVRA